MVQSIVLESASLDRKANLFCEKADAGPALRLHFVEVFEAGQVGSSVWSSGLCSLFADRVGSIEVINAGDLQGFSALLSCGKADEEGNQCEEDEFHRNILIYYT